jgi:DNA-binding winged helix-turn-helix (wHTH) protein/DNA-binding GntR family transcriptional regulator
MPRLAGGAPGLLAGTGAADGVLVNRLAAWVLAREPGRRLPRRSYLAGSYQATAAEIDTAIAELARRGIVRETAAGDLYRASPAEYLVTLDGLAQAGCRVHPAGGVLACVSRNVTRRAPPEEIAHALRLPADSQICAVQSTWSAGGTAAALSTAYLPGALAVSLGPGLPAGAPALDPLPLPAGIPPGTYPGALRMDMQPPHRQAARILNIPPSGSAVTITVRFDDPATRTPAALTVTVLDPARFSIVLQAPGGLPAAAGLPCGVPVPAPGPPHEPQAQPRVVQANGVRLDLDAQRVQADGTDVVLSRKEYDLLRVLVENAGQIVTSRDLLDIVWRPGYTDHNRSLTVHIGRLRRKLDRGSGISRIRAVRGIGYVFDVSPPPIRVPTPR